MPNASQRISDSTIKGMLSMFFMFNSLDDRIDISLHPKYNIVLNNVSKHGDNYDLETIEKDPNNVSVDPAASLSVDNRITEIKSQIKEAAKRFYLTLEISENTRVSDKVWKDIKDEVCKDESYKEESWYIELKDH